MSPKKGGPGAASRQEWRVAACQPDQMTHVFLDADRRCLCGEHEAPPAALKTAARALAMTVPEMLSGTAITPLWLCTGSYAREDGRRVRFSELLPAPSAGAAAVAARRLYPTWKELTVKYIGWQLNLFDGLDEAEEE